MLMANITHTTPAPRLAGEAHAGVKTLMNEYLSDFSTLARASTQHVFIPNVLLLSQGHVTDSMSDTSLWKKHFQNSQKKLQVRVGSKR